MKIVYFGTPVFSIPFLELLHKEPDIEVISVVTQPDKPSGRGQSLHPSPVKEWALTQNLPIYTPSTLKNADVQQHLASLEADVFIVVAYGKLIPADVLSIPPHGCLNVHPSLLPRFRGPAPIQAPILAGDPETGVSIMLLDEGMDTGPLLATERVSIDAHETALSLTEKLIQMGAPLLVRSLKRFVAGHITPLPQDDTHATVTSLIKKEDGHINWSTPADIIERTIRAYLPWPGAWTIWERNGTDLRLVIRRARPVSVEEQLAPGQVLLKEKNLYVGTETHPLLIEELQPSGTSVMDTKQFLNGYGDIDGALLA